MTSVIGAVRLAAVGAASGENIVLRAGGRSALGAQISRTEKNNREYIVEARVENFTSIGRSSRPRLKRNGANAPVRSLAKGRSSRGPRQQPGRGYGRGDSCRKNCRRFKGHTRFRGEKSC